MKSEIGIYWLCMCYASLSNFLFDASFYQNENVCHSFYRAVAKAFVFITQIARKVLAKGTHSTKFLFLTQIQMSAHKQRYKNVGLDSNEMRRRREEEGIQLRKQKREQQLIKRRNVDNLPTMDSELDNNITVRFDWVMLSADEPL